MDNYRKHERGNALIYVLIAIALFAALGFTLSRQTDTSEAGTLSREKAELTATQMISYSAQVKSAIDQMLFTAATNINELDFTPPSDATFDLSPVIHKVYHPQGGGLTPAKIPQAAVNEVNNDPVAGWYLGRFENVDWTSSSAQDVILVAYQIDETVCSLINKKVNGSEAIPALTSDMNDVFVDDALHSGTNLEFTTDIGDICPDCRNVSSLCVSNNGATAFSYYTIIADQ